MEEIDKGKEERSSVNFNRLFKLVFRASTEKLVCRVLYVMGGTGLLAA
jgi:hypothetical protein